MYLKIPTVLIPLPKTNSRGDQILNADYFERLGLAHVLPQKNLTANSLFTAIKYSYENRFNHQKALIEHPIVDASRQISRIIADCAMPQF